MFKFIFTFLFVGLLMSCKSDEKPAPIILDLVDGVVKTTTFEEIPLPHHQKEGYTEVFLFPKSAVDIENDKVSLKGKKRAATIGAFMMGFNPELILAADDPIDQYLMTPSSSLLNVSIFDFTKTKTAEQLGKEIRQNHLGKRTAIVGEVAFLEEFVDAFSDRNILSSWPKEGHMAAVHVAFNENDEVVTPFQLVVDFEN